MMEQLIRILKNGGLSDEQIFARLNKFKQNKDHLATITSQEPPPVEQRPKKNFGFVILKACNMDCEFCIWDCAPRDNSQIVTPEFFEECIIKLKKEGYTSCGLIGGEVGLHPKFRELVEILVKHEINFTMVTNAKKWEMYKFLIENEEINKYFGSISISLDGKKETHDRYRGKGSYNKVIEALDYFHDKKDTSIKMVLRNDNFKDLDHVCSIAKKYSCEIGGFDVKLQTDRGIHLGQEGLKELYKINPTERYDKLTLNTLFNVSSEPCWTCSNFFSREILIYPDGEIGFCCAGLLDDTPIANIKTDSVQEILNKKLEVGMYLLNTITPIIYKELPLTLRDSCALCRQAMGCIK